MKVQTAISTQNKRGFTYTLTSFGKAFVNAASKATHPVMDIGAAYGVATLPALLTGARVVAVDIEESHLQAIHNTVGDVLQPHLKTMRGRFPHFDMENESLSAVYMSQVLPFLNGDEIEAGARKVYDWLIPGGEVFIVSFTPYIDHVKAFIPVYEERRREGVRWAGYIDDVAHYSHDPAIYSHLPNQIHHVDADDLTWAFQNAGFTIREVRYFGEEEGELPSGIRMDGRERVGLVAVKPFARDYRGELGHWESIATMPADIVPPVLREWLYKPFVLSHALKRVCSNFAVSVCDQSIKPMYADEISALQCYTCPDGYVRETYLGNVEDPLVYARVTMPETTYRACQEELDTLGNRPIGETLLYNNPHVTRSGFEVKRVTGNDELLFDVLVHSHFFKAEVEKSSRIPELWARRSIFHMHGHPLLITEVFLCNIPDYRD
ncbi:chorismate lyase [Parachryseolinea silvisoli]|jgi:chorismate-pyruvate lyase/SAM-dependent methyltransferase|uniref:chorismate lyase n=1 Tax=Parachryseolinea silvisoli TaxID=2873601 RepID=UPI002265BB15|nr:chorismate lyase [Parachryseolinea silvisoli]MCD9015965.1 chorismate lyase [Parachryseolinea silvisoli]